MVFTLTQWNSLQEGEFHIGAAPINPSELGRNSRYVFALPARYNYAFPEGFEEVSQILRSRPLRTFEPAEHTDTASQNASPVAVAFASETQGWVIAGDCTDSGNGRCSVLATRDGGKTWTEQYSGTVGLREIYFIDPDHGWVLGGSSQGPDGPWSSVLLATTDGGKTWKPRWAGDGSLSGLQFLDASHGWALAMIPVAGGGKQHRGRELRKTQDGGATWSVVSISGLTPTSASFVDPEHGWIVGSTCSYPDDPKDCSAAILSTDDGGRTWHRQMELPSTESGYGSTITFVSRNNGWLLSFAPAYCTMGGCWGSLYRTTDGGRTWTALQETNRWRITGDQSSMGGPGFPGAPKFISSTVGWIPISAGAATGVGGIAFTMDGGQTWTRVGGEEGWSIRGVSAVSAQEVWAVGTDHPGRIRFLVHSTDGGRTWTQLLGGE